MYYQFWGASCDLCIVTYDSAITEYNVVKIITAILMKISHVFLMFEASSANFMY